MGSEAVVIGQVLISLIEYLMLWAKNTGLSDAECNSLILEAMIKVRASKPENLPDV